MRSDIPTWAEFTGWEQGGNQNTVRYAHFNLSGGSATPDRLPAYRQIVDLGNE